MTCESGCDFLPGKIQFLSGSGRVGNDGLGMSMGSVRGGQFPLNCGEGNGTCRGRLGGMVNASVAGRVVGRLFKLCLRLNYVIVGSRCKLALQPRILRRIIKNVTLLQ